MNLNAPFALPPRLAGRIAAALATLLASAAIAAPAPLETGSGDLLVRDAAGQLRQLPLLEIDVAIHVTGVLARTEVRQTFRNPDRDDVDAVYLFPLPEASAVDSLHMKIGDRIIEGEIQEKEQARQTYETARLQGKKASLLEQKRPNLFRASVANIGPGETVQIRIGYQEVLRYDLSRFSLRFPMTYTPRYGPPLGGSDPGSDPEVGSAGVPATDMAAATGPAFTSNGPSASVRVRIQPGFPLRRLASPSHEAAAIQAVGTAYDVFLGRVPADRDFVLYWEPDLCAVPRGSLLLEEWRGDLYGLLVLMPPDPAQSGPGGFTRELILVVDTSGSMGGPSIGQARQALLAALAQLGPGDYFNLIQFNSETEVLFEEGSRQASGDAVAAAERYVRRLHANGGTEMFPALRRALESPPTPARMRQIVFVTDGAVSYEGQLFGYLRAELGEARLFTVGIGAAPNSHFMRGAAEAGRGTFTHIGDPRQVEEEMRRLFSKLDSFALSDLRVDWGGAEAWPRQIPDLYLGEPLVVAARLSKVDDTIRIEGRREDGEVWSETLGVVPLPSERGIHKLWARKKIEGLLSLQSQGVRRDRIREAVLDTALVHRLVSPFTSLVAVERVPTRPGSAARLRVPNQTPVGSVLPAGATRAPLTAVLGVLSLLAALALWRLGGRWA